MARQLNESGQTTSPTLANWLDERASELEGQYALAAMGCAPVTHCPTGLRRLDDAGLLELGVCTVVLGHEGDGKSALGLALVEGAARAGFEAAGYWPEDPRRFLADRVLSKGLGVSASSLRRLKLPPSAASGLGSAASSASEWASRVRVSDERLTSRELIAHARATWTPNTRLLLVDYAQVFSAEKGDGGGYENLERVLTRTVWDLNELAKEKNAAVVLMSQVKTEVKERGRRLFDSWSYRNQGKTPNQQAVEGYRPLAGDGQWAPSALGQKARAVLSWFRPNYWLGMHGVDVSDDIAEALIIKSNYGPAAKTIRLGWDGPQTRIYDPKDVTGVR